MCISMCVYVYVYLYVLGYMYVYMYACVYVYVYACDYTYVYVYVYMWYINECTCINKIKKCTYFLVAVKSLSQKLCLHFFYVDCC